MIHLKLENQKWNMQCLVKEKAKQIRGRKLDIIGTRKAAGKKLEVEINE